MPSGEAGAENGQDDGSLTPEEAARYLQSLEEGRPDRRRPAKGRQRRPVKDW